MIEVTVGPISEGLFHSYGKPDPEALEALNARAMGTVTSLLGDKNEVWLGKPQVHELRRLQEPSGARPSPVQLLLEASDLYVVHLAASFRPAPDCRFVRGTVRAHLEASSPSVVDPIAHDLFPRNVEMITNYSTKLLVKPTLKLGLEKVGSVEASAFEAEQSKSYFRYEPELTAFGAGESSPGWDFHRATSRSIRGIKDLFILVGTERGSTATVRFEISAWVQTDIGGIPLSTFFLSGSDRPLAEERIVIKPS